MRRKTQKEMLRDAEIRSARTNNLFLYLWNHATNPLTKDDLRANIKRNPAVWARFEGYLKEEGHA